MSALLCLGVAGVLVAQLPGSDFTLAWQHSVEKVRWEQDYRLEQGRLHLIEARVRGSGAGMEIPTGARLHNGSWRYVPNLPSLAVLRLGRSSAGDDYELCQSGRCVPMSRWLGAPQGEPAEVWGCENPDWAEPLKPR